MRYSPVNKSKNRKAEHHNGNESPNRYRSDGKSMEKMQVPAALIRGEQPIRVRRYRNDDGRNYCTSPPPDCGRPRQSCRNNYGCCGYLQVNGRPNGRYEGGRRKQKSYASHQHQGPNNFRPTWFHRYSPDSANSKRHLYKHQETEQPACMPSLLQSSRPYFRQILLARIQNVARVRVG